MEIVEIIVGIIALLSAFANVIIGFFAWRKSREVGDMRVRLAEIESQDNADQRDSDKDMAWLNALATQTTLMQTMVATLQSQASDINEIKTPIIQMQDMVDGARRQMQQFAGSNTQALQDLKAAVDEMPSAVREALVDDFQTVGDSLSGLRAKTDEALQEWAKTGARLQQYLNDSEKRAREALEAAQKTDTEQPEPGAETPDTDAGKAQES